MSTVERKRAAHAARLLKLAASSTRASILFVLSRHKQLAVQDIAAELDMTHSAVSHQLAVLAGADIVTSKKSGRMMCYAISKNPQAKALVKFLTTVK
ncbi:MAG: winged helix-turn-helix transcriptional regulator [Candidatus Pacebacteria bacterium]|jgi:DNA-binding transcriptional ArsR family regulator|nr:winged helix-turn-helix transcriptional regulator [Candidatus Paceibacterota bacterium]